MPETEFAPRDQYWCSLPNEELIKHLVKRRRDFADMMIASGLCDRIGRNWEYYHGLYHADNGTTGMEIKREHEESGVALANINHFRSFVDQYVTYVVQNKPAWDSRVLNTDWKSRNQALLFNDLLDAYMEIGHAEEDLRRAFVHAIVLSAGFCYVQWNPFKGNVIRPDEDGKPIFEGDLDFTTPTIFDVSWDFSIPDFRDAPWIQIRTPVNRWDLIEQYPKMEEELQNAPMTGGNDASNDYNSFGQIGLKNPLTDTIDIYEFWHKVTPAMPEGRHMAYFADQHALGEDNEPNFYRILPIARVIPSEFILTCMGYTHAFDLQVPQEWYGANLSTILTNLNNLGRPKIWMSESCSVTDEELEPGNGHQILRGGQNPPVVLDFLAKVKDLTEPLELAKQEEGLMAGIGPVSRGTPEGELKGASGAAFALLDSKSIQSTTLSGQRHREFQAEVGTIALHVLQKKALTKRVTALAGKDNRVKLREWSADDISEVDRVVVEMGSPLQRSISGKVQIADALREQGWISTPQEYLTVIETGQWKSMVSSIESQLSIIADENERLRDNYETADQLLRAYQTVAVLGNDPGILNEITAYLQQIGVQVIDDIDNHILHIRRHSSILDCTELRMVRGIVVPCGIHIQQHFEALMDPLIQKKQLLLGYITGQQLQEFMLQNQIMAPPAGPVGPGGPPSPGGPAGGPPGSPIAANLEPNPPPPETPLPMSETGRPPKPPKIPRAAVGNAIAQGTNQP